MYVSHSSDNCSGVTKQYKSTNKYLVGSLGKQDSSVKHFCKSGNRMYKELKHINKNNTAIFKMTNKGSFSKYMRKIHIIKAVYCDSSSRSIESEYLRSYNTKLEGEKPRRGK